jgi:hypothetical protein
MLELVLIMDNMCYVQFVVRADSLWYERTVCGRADSLLLKRMSVLKVYEPKERAERQFVG